MAVVGAGFKTVYTTALTSNSATDLEGLGTIRVERDGTTGEKWYMYVQASGNLTKGKSVVVTGSPYVVAASTAAAKVARQKIAGVCLGAITTAYYGWIQIRGHNTSILSSPGLCTSACTWSFYASGGVFSINKCTQKCGCTAKIPAGVFTYTKVAVASSTSGFIACWS